MTLTLSFTPRPDGKPGSALTTSAGEVWATVYAYRNSRGKERWTAQVRAGSPAGHHKLASGVDTEEEARAWVLGVLGVRT